MFEIYNKRKQFWQWDTGQKLIVHEESCSEVHFCNGTSDCSLVCEIYEENGVRLVNVPNILFQTPLAIRAFVYVCDGEDHHTQRMETFPVFKRTKPDDYVYTETEVLNYSTLLRRIEMLEQNGGSGGGISQETDPTVPDWAKQPKKPTYTAEEVGAATKEQFNQLSDQLSGEIADKLDADKLPEAINTALAQAKASGEFDGEPGASGDDYVLTEADKTEIAQMAVDLLPKYSGEVDDV